MIWKVLRENSIFILEGKIRQRENKKKNNKIFDTFRKICIFIVELFFNEENSKSFKNNYLIIYYNG